MSLEWRGAPVEPGPGVPDPPSWEQVTVPGRPAQFAGRDAVAYRTEFSDPRDPGEEHAVLVLDGVYAHARIWLNGELVAEHDAYFEPLRVGLPVAEDNLLIVECRAPEDRFGGVHDTAAVPDERSVPGIWWRATLETYPDPYVEALDVRPTLGAFDGPVEDAEDVVEEVGVDVRATVVTDEPLDDRLTLSLRPDGEVRGGGMMNRAQVDADPGRTVVETHVEVRDPSLWWPTGLGGQPLYVVRAKLDDAERRTRTGLRIVTATEDGVAVNGTAVPVRGVTVVDPEPEDLERAAAANANLVRGHASALSPSVYDACDERGLLVWQDLPLTGPGAFDVERGVNLAARLVAARDGHPSLAAFAVHDDPVTDVGDGLGSGWLDRLRYRYRAWRATYDGSDPDRVADAVDAVPTFPVIGPPGVAPDAAALYPGWIFGAPTDLGWLCDRYDLGDVVAEFGAGSLGAREEDADGRAGAPAADGAPAPETATDGGAAADPGYDRRRIVERGGDDPENSQAYQARVVGSVAEDLRRRGAGVVVCEGLRDHRAGGMGILDSDGEPKAAFERLAAAYRPVQVVLADPSPGESDVVVLHDRPRAATVTVEWDVNGDREQTEVHVGAYGRAAVETLKLAAGDDVTLAVAVDGDVSRNDYAV